MSKGHPAVSEAKNMETRVTQIYWVVVGTLILCWTLHKWNPLFCIFTQQLLLCSYVPASGSTGPDY